MWADCPDLVQGVISENIGGTIQAKMEKEHVVGQARHEGYTNHWEETSAELQSQESSQPTQRPGKRIQIFDNWAHQQNIGGIICVNLAS